MNVIVSNKNEGMLSSLDVEVIKSLKGEFTADEIIRTFSNFFFSSSYLVYKSSFTSINITVEEIDKKSKNNKPLKSYLSISLCNKG